MKPLHTSELSTASDSRMVVRVMEISTPDGPVRRIVVTADAEMSPDEARWLRDKLDLAITLAESTEPVEGDRVTRFLDAWRQEKERFEPAVSEDQPKPREWHRSDPCVCRHGQNWHPTGRACGVDGCWCSLFTPSFADSKPLSEVLADSEQVRHG